mgnify:CR=1 FL=1
MVAQVRKLLLGCLSERYIIFSYRLIYNPVVNGDKSSSVGQIQQTIQAVFKAVGIILLWVIEAEAGAPLSLPPPVNSISSSALWISASALRE